MNSTDTPNRAIRQVTLIVALALQCIAPFAGAEGTKDTQPPDRRDILKANEMAATFDLPFETAEKIDGSTFGLIGDGRTDNTQKFRILLLGGNRTIHIQAGDYVTDKLNIGAKTILILDRDVTIRDAGRLGMNDRFINITKDDVRIIGHGSRVVADRSQYTVGEQRHGVFIFGANRVTIDGLESDGHGGDGFYIGGPQTRPSTDIVLRNCTADGNRRQGLSITSARRVRIIDCTFTHTNGTAPQFGIDLEPNKPSDSMEDILLVRPRTAGNKGGGILIYLRPLNSTSSRAEVTVLDHSTASESPPLRSLVPSGVTAKLRYSASH